MRTRSGASSTTTCQLTWHTAEFSGQNSADFMTGTTSQTATSLILLQVSWEGRNEKKMETTIVGYIEFTIRKVVYSSILGLQDGSQLFV